MKKVILTGDRPTGVHVVVRVKPGGEIPVVVVIVVSEPQARTVGEGCHRRGHLVEAQVNGAYEHVERERFVAVAERKHAVLEMVI